MKLSLLLPKTLLLWLLLLLSTQSSAQPQEVLTGTYVINVYDLNIDQHSFSMDFYIWFKWKGDLNPMKIEFVNAIEKWDIVCDPFYTEPSSKDGYCYNGMRYEGRFFHAFDLERYPLDEHFLDVQIENEDYPQDSIIYIPEEDTTYVREGLKLPGWTILGTPGKPQTHRYPINFGETVKPEVTYSNFVFKLKLERPFNYFLLKLLLPLLIVICVCLGALLINPDSIDARISLPIGGLLSAVFLQQSYSSTLPDVGYMVLMDKIYLLAYALIAATMLRVVLTSNQVINRRKELDMRRVRKHDRRLILALIIFLITGIGILLI